MPQPDRPDTIHHHYRVEVTLNIPQLDALARLEGKLDTIIKKENTIMATIDEILTEIADESTIADSILVIVQRLVSENDPAARQKILDGLKSNRTKFEASVLAGTPQAPTP
jgi:hypothetical protein